MSEISPLDTAISLFHSATDAQNPETITARGMFQRIQTGYYGDIVTPLRRMHGDAYKQAKKNLPCPTYGGRFSYRNTKQESLLAASGLATIDLDGMQDRLLAVKDTLAHDPIVVACFESPSQQGLKALFRK